MLGKTPMSFFSPFTVVTLIHVLLVVGVSIRIIKVGLPVASVLDFPHTAMPSRDASVRVLPVICAQNAIKVRCMRHHQLRLIKELLGGDGEKFRFVGSGIVAEKRFLAFFDVMLETQILLRTCPNPVAIFTPVV